MYGYSIASAQILVCTLYHFRRWGLNIRRKSRSIPCGVQARAIHTIECYPVSAF